jgi:putative ABC transport system substrate-binding protein
MKRREFITLLGGAAAAWPLAARAQQPALPVIGWLDSVSLEERRDWLVRFRQGLQEVGLVVGENVAFEYRSSQGQYERLPALAAELVSRRVAVIVANSNNAAVVAKAVTAATPIVFLVGADPVKLGLVSSLNRPGGNMTGVTSLGTTIMTKVLGLLHELIPAASVIALLLNPDNPNAGPNTNEVQEAARALGLQIHVLRANSDRDLETAFANLAQVRAGALLIEGDPFFTSRRDRLVALAAEHSIPAIASAASFAAAGGLMNYSSSDAERYRLVGVYAGRILKGAKPADLPVVQSSKFELVINLKTAKALGLTIPPVVLAIADEVIE